jgi:flavin reductase (DIM6/NTAB) family NADH-FMN oxidoreductase RutF
MKGIDLCGSLSGSKYDKFNLSGLTAVKSDVVNAPLISECPVSIECSLTDVIERDYYKGITNILASIKGRCISKDLLDEENHLIHSDLDPVLYVGDNKLKVYRYTEKKKSDASGSFI